MLSPSLELVSTTSEVTNPRSDMQIRSTSALALSADMTILSSDMSDLSLYMSDRSAYMNESGP